MRNKLLLFTTALLFTTRILLAQSNKPVKFFTKSLKTEYSLTTQQITLAEKTDSFSLNIDQRIDFLQVLIQGGDLVVDYELLGFPKIEKGMEMQLNLSVFNPNFKYQTAALPNQLHGKTSLPYTPKNQKNQLIWENWVENIKPQGNTLSLHLDALLVGRNPVNCDMIPEWTNRQKIPHYIAAGVGTGLFISSFSVRKKSDELYKQYITESFADQLDAPITYTNANNKHKLANTLIGTGIGIIATDLLSLGIRYLRYKKKQKEFEYYCNPSEAAISFQPVLERNSIGDHQIGFQLSYTF